MAGAYTKDPKYLEGRNLLKAGKTITVEYADTGEHKTTDSLSILQSLFRYRDAYPDWDDFAITGVREATPEEGIWYHNGYRAESEIR